MSGLKFVIACLAIVAALAVRPAIDPDSDEAGDESSAYEDDPDVDRSSLESGTDKETTYDEEEDRLSDESRAYEDDKATGRTLPESLTERVDIPDNADSEDDQVGEKASPKRSASDGEDDGTLDRDGADLENSRKAHTETDEDAAREDERAEDGASLGRSTSTGEDDATDRGSSDLSDARGDEDRTAEGRSSSDGQGDSNADEQLAKDEDPAESGSTGGEEESFHGERVDEDGRVHMDDGKDADRDREISRERGAEDTDGDGSGTEGPARRPGPRRDNELQGASQDSASVLKGLEARYNQLDSLLDEADASASKAKEASQVWATEPQAEIKASARNAVNVVRRVTDDLYGRNSLFKNEVAKPLEEELASHRRHHRHH